MLLQSPKSARSSLWSWEELGAGGDIPVSGRQDTRRISGGGGPRGVCAVASGLLLSVICGLHQRPWGGRLGFPWVPRAPASVWGELGAGGVRWGLLCSVAAMAEEGAFQTGRGKPPTHPPASEAAASLKWQEWIFQGTPAICSRGPRQKSFHDGLKSYSFLLKPLPRPTVSHKGGHLAQGGSEFC